MRLPAFRDTREQGGSGWREVAGTVLVCAGVLHISVGCPRVRPGRPAVRGPLTAPQGGAVPALVLFWSTASPPSTMMIRDLAELSRGDSGRIRFVAVHVGPERTGLPRADSGLIEFVPDPERECAGRLGVAALPTVVVLDRRRQEAVRFEGYSPALVEAVMQAVAVQGGG